MNKYFSIFKISFQQEFVYKLNFIMWRVRNIMQITVFYFLWNAAFSENNPTLFGYDKSKILTYALLLIIVRALALSSRSADVAGQIAGGELSNLLLKPINFFKFWLVRDISSKILNILFSVIEITVLFLILKPPFVFQTDPSYVLLFMVSIIISMFIYFNILLLTSFVPFWYPEFAWGAQFLVIAVIVEFLSGSFFPLDVFPSVLTNLIMFTPFPFLIFIPIKTYLGNFSVVSNMQYLLIGLVWSLVLWQLTNLVWKKGLKIYEGVGR